MSVRYVDKHNRWGNWKGALKRGRGRLDSSPSCCTQARAAPVNQCYQCLARIIRVTSRCNTSFTRTALFPKLLHSVTCSVRAESEETEWEGGKFEITETDRIN